MVSSNPTKSRDNREAAPVRIIEEHCCREERHEIGRNARSTGVTGNPVPHQSAPARNMPGRESNRCRSQKRHAQGCASVNPLSNRARRMPALGGKQTPGPSLPVLSWV